MRPYKKKIKKQERASIQESTSYETNVMNGIKWRQILSEGKTVELIDGCGAKCDGTFEDL